MLKIPESGRGFSDLHILRSLRSLKDGNLVYYNFCCC